MVAHKFEWTDRWSVVLSDGNNRLLVPLDEWPALVEAVTAEAPRTVQGRLFRQHRAVEAARE
jgi:hypothetical protein